MSFFDYFVGLLFGIDFGGGYDTASLFARFIYFGFFGLDF
jgi:hypothetical protein